MIYLKKYESSGSPFIYKADGYFWIHKINFGANKGKILFRFYNEESRNYADSNSMLLGCFRILGTKHEYDPKLRKIKLGGEKFRKLYYGTLDAIVKRLEDVKYTTNEMRKQYEDKLQDTLTLSKNLGDVMDGLKIMKDINKYNV